MGADDGDHRCGHPDRFAVQPPGEPLLRLGGLPAYVVDEPVDLRLVQVGQLRADRAQERLVPPSAPRESAQSTSRPSMLSGRAVGEDATA
ncbi:hypothetical protein [Micromonospora sp. b486]|uniref:hypothetical protein n=1 Tax=Micromonospora sp. b486 TaxID=3053986 RepID=UPI00259CAAE7|nr:hypothetical protein [Micromonospora sp. b486]MDM4784522.1 hypothetical protein [Micromonospora sp. b486]